MNDTKEIGDRLKAARIYAGFPTATEAAESLGVKYQTYAAHENGNRGVARACEKYARRYNVSLDWLLTGKGKGPGERDDLLQQFLTYWPDVPDRERQLLVGNAQSFAERRRNST